MKHRLRAASCPRRGRAVLVLAALRRRRRRKPNASIDLDDERRGDQLGRVHDVPERPRRHAPAGGFDLPAGGGANGGGRRRGGAPGRRLSRSGRARWPAARSRGVDQRRSCKRVQGVPVEARRTAGGGSGGGANAQAFQAYMSCLRDHGVTVPTTTPGSTPRGRPGGRLGRVRNDPKFAAANKTCQALLPTRNGIDHDDGPRADEERCASDCS